MMSAFQHDLLQINQSSGIHPNTQRLLSAVTRCNSVMDSIRGFVASVVEPPLDLVFHETEAFDADITKISGWRIHLQYVDGKIVLKDVIEGSRHDDVLKVIRTKKGRYN